MGACAGYRYEFDHDDSNFAEDRPSEVYDESQDEELQQMLEVEKRVLQREKEEDLESEKEFEALDEE